MRYVAKPVEVQAMLWRGSLIDDLPSAWIEGGRVHVRGETLIIDTIEGPAVAHPGKHYVVEGTEGELYPVKRSIFEAKYREASDV